VGKGFRNDKLMAKVRPAALAIALFLTLLIRVAEPGAASEVELFDQGYGYYLSYQPEMAVETLNKFLSEFPRSSARDAALFWIGKSLVRMESFEKAGKVFANLRREFPESPFIPHVERELGNLGTAPTQKKMHGGGQGGGKAVHGSETSGKDKNTRAAEERLARALEETKRLGALLKDEKRKTEELQVKMREIEKKEAGGKAHVRKGEDEQKRIAAEIERDRAQLREERERLDAERRSIRQEAKGEGPRGNAKEEGQITPRRFEAPAVKIRGEQYTTLQVIDFMLSSSAAMGKSGIREVPWRSGNLFEDFVNEQILYGEAVRGQMSADLSRVNELAGRFNLTADEAEYLRRYLSISDLIDRKVKSTPEERVVESLTVHYSDGDGDKQRKVTLVTDLQEQARGGKSFEEIAAAFPDRVRFSVIDYQELQGWIKDRIELLKAGEISVVWTKDGYMVLKTAMKRPSYRPFEDTRPDRKNEIRAFVKAWIEMLRKDIKDIEIARTVP
jgi:hypothetical protein